MCRESDLETINALAWENIVDFSKKLIKSTYAIGITILFIVAMASFVIWFIKTGTVYHKTMDSYFYNLTLMKTEFLDNEEIENTNFDNCFIVFDDNYIIRNDLYYTTYEINDDTIIIEIYNKSEETLLPYFNRPLEIFIITIKDN